MTFLRVDIDQLTRFARTLDSSLLSLREARSALDHVRAGQLGTADLDAACDGFQERWAYGTRELAKRVKTVREGVDTSAVEHAKLDAAIRAAFLKAGGGPT